MKKKKLLLAVIDTNAIVSGFINRFGSPHKLIRKLRKNLFKLSITNNLWTEYEEVLSRPKLISNLDISKEEMGAILRRIKRGSIMITGSINIPIEIRDPKDEKILSAALSGKADYLVTGDKDLLDLKDNPKLGSLKIVTIQEFLKSI